jgi:hypothetical protein
MQNKKFPISRQIREAVKVMEENGWKYPTRRIEDKMRKLGFKVCKSTGVAFIGDKQVIKAHYPVKKRNPSEKIIIPTIKICRIEATKNQIFDWVIQPKAQLLKLKEYNSYLPIIKKRFNSVKDNHWGNFGFYKNKLVLIDW